MLNVVALVGKPGAGKTTLLKAVAAVTAVQTVAVGDQIRADRALAERLASLGDGMLASTYSEHCQILAQVLTLAFQQLDQTSLTIVDGSIGLDVALQILQIRPRAVVHLETSDTVRARRIRSRAEHGDRADDRPHIWEAREQQFGRFVWGEFGEDPTVPRYRINGDVTRERAVHQLLSVLQLETRIPRPEIELGRISSDSAELPAFIEAQRAAERPRALASTTAPNAGVNDPVVLIKPTTYVTSLSETVADVIRRFESNGYLPARIAVWPHAALAASTVVATHFNDHFLYAKYATTVLDLAELREDSVCSGFDVAIDDLRSIDWASPESSRKIRDSLWLYDGKLHEGERPSGPIVNGHVPVLMDNWISSLCPVVAIQFEGSRRSWNWIRNRVVGASDPRSAAANSIRRDAYAGRIPGVSGTPTMMSNVVHCSAGPLEASREALVWFGRDGVRDIEGQNTIWDSQTQRNWDRTMGVDRWEVDR